MWDDPLFNPDAEALKYHLVTHPDADYAQQHRRLRLLCLEAFCKEIALLKERNQRLSQVNERLAAQLEKADEAARSGFWMMHRLIKKAGCEEFLDKIEQVQIDARVAKQVDTEFSFAKAISME